MKNNKYQIISDGSCDLKQELIDKHSLEVVPFYVSFNNEVYEKEGIDFSVHDFYQKMVDNPTVYPKTSTPTTEDYKNAFIKYAKDGIDIICICITSKFSSSISVASSAKQEVEKIYNVNITIIDSTMNTCIQGVLVLEALRMQSNGLDYFECINKINEIKSTGRIFFTVGSLDYLRHGGRIGKLTGLIGATLKIKPLIVLKEGEIYPLGITWTKNQSIVKVVEHLRRYLEKTMEGNINYDNYLFIVGSGYNNDDALKLKSVVNSKLGINNILVGQIGATIGVHTGPYPIGIGVIKKYDA